MKTSQKILNIIKSKKQVTGNELAIEMGLTSRAVRKQLKKLFELGLVLKKEREYLPKVTTTCQKKGYKSRQLQYSQRH